MTMDWIQLGPLKPVLAACVLPPVPFLVLAMFGAWRARAGRRSGTTIVFLACAGIWLSCCDAVADGLGSLLPERPPALTAGDRADLAARAARGESMAIVVLGGGLDQDAPEYGRGSPGALSLERIRYGAWLSRRTNIPLAVSGGTGWAGDRSTPEADVLGDIAAEEFQRAPRWREGTSRDTHQNAVNTIALLAPQGVRELVVVTHAWHMPRALREFRTAAAAAAAGASGATPIAIRAAPMGTAPSERPILQWMPSGSGAMRVRTILREVLAASVMH